MTAPTLRPFQAAGVEAIEAARERGVRSLLVASPTGSGKTIIAGELIRRENAAGRRVMFMAPRRELVTQAFDKLGRFDVVPGVLLAGDRRTNLMAMSQVASVDTLRSRVKRLVSPDPHTIIIDEAHCYVTRARTELIGRWPGAFIVGLTATPDRKDGRGLRLLFDEMIEIATTAELTERGYLVPARYFSIAEPDLRGVHTLAGDYQQDELAARVAPLVGDIPRTWLERAPGRRTVVFAVNVKHSIALRDAFSRHGVHAEHVDGTTPTALRAEIFARFISGQTQVLCNCLIATLGFDLPELDCVVLARPTKSLVLYLQMLGRGLRTADSKQDCLVLDHSGAVHRHGFATDPRVWSLDGHANLDDAARRAAERTAPKQITCPECACVFQNTLQCPECRHYMERHGKDIATHPGELVEVGEHEAISLEDRIQFHAELRGFAEAKQYKPAWAAHKFREKFGTFPPWSWNSRPLSPPTLATRRWVQSRWIAWRKAQGRA